MAQKSLSRLLLQPLAIAIVLAVLVRLALQLYSVQSVSMAPTLLPGDYLLVTPYRFGSEPAPGHVIVFHSPADGTLLVKRVIATPGELVDSRFGRLRVGGYTVAEPYVPDPASTGSIQPQIVPPTSYFVLGDNRLHSRDSRSWGPVRRDQIVGRARVIGWNLQRHRAGAAGVEAGVPPRRFFKWVR